MMDLSLPERDQRVIWHPYTQHKNMPAPVGIVRGEGPLLFDESGKAYIDAISSWWVNIHGHAHPYIAQRIYEQAKRLEHVIFTGFTHEPAVLLAERLLPILPGKFSKVFYSDNGSTAVEVALKIAIQYWKNLRADLKNPENPSRTKILAFRNAYHGDTFGAMSVSERGTFTIAFQDYLFEVIFIDTPNAGNLSDLMALIREHADRIACFIFEPLLQAAGGMRVYDAASMNVLMAYVQSMQILCIADEVMTGFGRSGKTFAGDWLEVKADIICLSKGLTAGTMALGITACTQKIFDAFLSSDRSRTFFHGHSFTANPIACSAALASLDLLEKEACTQGIQMIVREHRQFANSLRKTSHVIPVKCIRQLGTMVAFELDNGQDGYLNSIGSNLAKDAMEEGIYLRPLGNTVYLLPPYCITKGQLGKLYAFLSGWLQKKPGKA